VKREIIKKENNKNKKLSLKNMLGE